MSDYDISKYIEFITFSSYLIFIFLSVQIWLLWKDADKNELKLGFVSEAFFRKNCAYLFSFSLFSMVHFFEEAASSTFYNVLEMLAIVSLVLFAYSWHNALKACAKKSLPGELISFAR